MVTAMWVIRQPLEMGNGHGRKATEFLLWNGSRKPLKCLGKVGKRSKHDFTWMSWSMLVWEWASLSLVKYDEFTPDSPRTYESRKNYSRYQYMGEKWREVKESTLSDQYIDSRFLEFRFCPCTMAFTLALFGQGTRGSLPISWFC